MQIVWKGHACFFITASHGNHSQVKIVFDPYDESIGLRLPSMEADLVLVSHDHYDHNNAKAIKKEPFIASSPGEYEVKGVFVKGIPSFHDNSKGKERGRNTIFVVDAEDMRLCHLGDLGQSELTSEQVDQIGEVDILFVPVGGTYTIDAKEASHIVSQIEPKIAVPMHYALPNVKVKLAGVGQFLKTMGVKTEEPLPKLSLKHKDLDGEETKVVVLSP
ncbi:MAG: Zn-dependent hydrolase [Parcubacteria group bacterium GW2011_GWA1_48_11b]|nr:MAG: Zn-dependent hydrolase [Parcubacteria group bacterium GW2011_GWA1_48_11b]